jgi:hypothetical protein
MMGNVKIVALCREPSPQFVQLVPAKQPRITSLIWDQDERNNREIGRTYSMHGRNRKRTMILIENLKESDHL